MRPSRGAVLLNDPLAFSPLMELELRERNVGIGRHETQRMIPTFDVRQESEVREAEFRLL